MFMPSYTYPKPEADVCYAMMDTRPGTYALILATTSRALIEVGRRGSLQIHPGFYVYVGSAHGPGGLRARLAHHLGPSRRPHWHLDYLRPHITPEEVWYCCDSIRWECRWAHCIGMQREASTPMAGFGSSDCNCGSHLFFFEDRPSRAAFAPALGKVRALVSPSPFAWDCPARPLMSFRV